MKKETRTGILRGSWSRRETRPLRSSWDGMPRAVLQKEKIRGVVEGMVLGISDNSYDLNLAAVVEYNGWQKPELVFHGQSRADSTGNVRKRTAKPVSGAGSDETMVIHLGKIQRM